VSGLGSTTLRGVLSLSTSIVVLTASGAQNDWISSVLWTQPLVGRESEVALLLERGSKSKLGTGTSSYSRVMQALVKALGANAKGMSHRTACTVEVSEFEYSQTRHVSVTDLFQRLLQFETGDTQTRSWRNRTCVSQYRLPWRICPLFAPLLSLPVLTCLSSAQPLTTAAATKTLENYRGDLLELANISCPLYLKT